ncbi:unnamed protein product [Hyaloperonospora brassicae]|uniref:Uncharacterized protein n=1 Tax=Hyaloperonospora brassicae TaxID=162125 RepID=A0AAV0T2A3_HYABA|nr:unnamed protein product [Hyaloperonospora brassicae]
MFSAAGQVPLPAEPPLPLFSTQEIRLRKARDANTLLFFVPTHSSLLLSLRRPVSHASVARDARCLRLLQTVALVPSCKWNKALATVTTALELPVCPRVKRHLEETLGPLIAKLRQESSGRPLICLQLKAAVAECLRWWMDDPVEGFVLRKEQVVHGMRLDDLVATPAGDGYLRGYRCEDGFCTVVYPWGHGFVHVEKVEKVEQAVETRRLKKKRVFNERVALEHEQLYEQIEGLLANRPSPVLEEQESTREAAIAALGEPAGEDVAQYTELLASLEEGHVDTTVLRGDLGLLRRVQALVDKVKEVRRSRTPHEPEHKQVRSDDDPDVSPEDDQQDPGQSVHVQEQSEGNTE